MGAVPKDCLGFDQQNLCVQEGVVKPLLRLLPRAAKAAAPNPHATRLSSVGLRVEFE